MSPQEIDMRPHPLGLTCHPEWEKVRNLYRERWCNWRARLADEQAGKARSAMRRDLGDLTKGLLLLLCLWVIAAMVGA